MSDGKERTEARLSNLEAIEPLLGSLRVLSLSTMQMALNRQASLTAYAERFSLVAAQVRYKVRGKPVKHKVEERSDHRPVKQSQVLAVIGSSRGICGQYNKQLARLASQRLGQKEGLPINVMAFGVGVSVLTQEGITFDRQRDFGKRGSQPAYEPGCPADARLDGRRVESSTLAKVSPFFPQTLGRNKLQPGFHHADANKR